MYISVPTPLRPVLVLLLEDVHALDFAGPVQAIFEANGFGARYALRYVGPREDLRAAQGFCLGQVEPLPPLDGSEWILVPGTESSRLDRLQVPVEWLRSAAERGCRISSICTGAFILAEVGLLDGRQVTTWYGATDRLQQSLPGSVVIDGKRFVDSGDVITTAGVSAGIDGSLHLVARLLGRAVADETAQYMEYRWTPEPYLARSYSLLNSSLDDRGRRLQHADLEARAERWDAAIAAYRAVLREEGPDPHVSMRLGQALYATGRHAQAAEAYLEALEHEDLRMRASYNAACSFALAGKTDRALESLRSAINAGFTSVDHVRRDEDLASLRDDPRFDELLERIE